MFTAGYFTFTSNTSTIDVKNAGNNSFQKQPPEVFCKKKLFLGKNSQKKTPVPECLF